MANPMPAMTTSDPTAGAMTSHGAASATPYRAFAAVFTLVAAVPLFFSATLCWLEFEGTSTIPFLVSGETYTAISFLGKAVDFAGSGDIAGTFQCLCSAASWVVRFVAFLMLLVCAVRPRRSEKLLKWILLLAPVSLALDVVSLFIDRMIIYPAPLNALGSVLLECGYLWSMLFFGLLFGLLHFSITRRGSYVFAMATILIVVFIFWQLLWFMYQHAWIWLADVQPKQYMVPLSPMQWSTFILAFAFAVRAVFLAVPTPPTQAAVLTSGAAGCATSLNAIAPQLVALKELHEAGNITKEEYDRRRRELLGL